jgi:NitT/TauT family transport system ATP-binding protein
MPVVVENVSHNFDGLNVLKDVSLSVADGEILAIVGPSGCGKSTLLSIIGGLLVPAGGRVLTAAEDKDSFNPLTFVFQDFALLPWRTVFDNVALPLEHSTLATEERREIVMDVLARTNLTEFRGAFPKQLSGGMRQRVGLARALAVRPTVLLMDEPLSALDSQTRELLMEDLSSLLEGTNLSVIYVTHNLDEAVRLADRVAVFSRRPGEIREIVTMTIPRQARGTTSAVAELAQSHKKLWSLIRDEALAAEREVTNV